MIYPWKLLKSAGTFLDPSLMDHQPHFWWTCGRLRVVRTLSLADCLGREKAIHKFFRNNSRHPHIDLTVSALKYGTGVQICPNMSFSQQKGWSTAESRSFQDKGASTTPLTLQTPPNLHGSVRGFNQTIRNSGSSNRAQNHMFQ